MRTLLDKLKSFGVVALCMLFGASMVYAMVSYATVMKLEPVKQSVQVEKVEQDGAGAESVPSRTTDSEQPIKTHDAAQLIPPVLTVAAPIPPRPEAEQIFSDLKRQLKKDEEIIAELLADNKRLRGGE